MMEEVKHAVKTVDKQTVNTLLARWCPIFFLHHEVLRGSAQRGTYQRLETDDVITFLAGKILPLQFPLVLGTRLAC
jgi:hypothetical protein